MNLAPFATMPLPTSTTPRLMDRVRQACRLRHFSPRTEDAYCHWIRRFIVFHGKRHPDELGEADIVAFLSSLAVVRQVSASTQNQALSSLLFLYDAVLHRPVASLEGVVRAATPARLPVVLSRDEVRRGARRATRYAPDSSRCSSTALASGSTRRWSFV